MAANEDFAGAELLAEPGEGDDQDHFGEAAEIGLAEEGGEDELGGDGGEFAADGLAEGPDGPPKARWPRLGAMGTRGRSGSGGCNSV